MRALHTITIFALLLGLIPLLSGCVEPIEEEPEDSVLITSPEPNRTIIVGQSLIMTWWGGPEDGLCRAEYTVEGEDQWQPLFVLEENDGTQPITFPESLIETHVEGVYVELRMSVGSILSDVVVLRVIADAHELPLLSAGQQASVVYSGAQPDAQAALDGAFNQSYSAGADMYQLYFRWSELEAENGTLDLDDFDSRLQTLATANYTPYCVISTIDTNTLQLPAGFVSESNPNALKEGVDFDDQLLVQRYEFMLSQVVPQLVEAGCFFISVGNEVDIWLQANPDQQEHFFHFVRRVRQHVSSIDSRMAVGVTFTDKIPVALWTNSLIGECDAIAFTYYLTGEDGQVRDPANVADHLDRMLSFVGADQFMLIQEAGCPSGYATSNIGASEAIQRDFYANLMAEVKTRPRIRYLNAMHLGDYSAAQVTEFEAFYGLSEPGFVEFLSTLGMHHADGTPKPAFQAWLDGVAALNQ